MIVHKTIDSLRWLGGLTLAAVALLGSTAARGQSTSASVATRPTAGATAPASLLATARQPPLTVSALLDKGPNRRTVLVPPTLEIELLDPNVDPLGNPAVLTRPGPRGLEVDIPPVVLVHKYYYTGDRSFQGPMLPGGPTILVFNHPATGARQYLEIQMLPGAPRVFYAKNAITYDYGPQAIIVSIGHHGKPSVTYREGVPLGEQVRRSREGFHHDVDDLAERSGWAGARRQARSGAKNAAGNAVDLSHTVAQRVAAPFVQLLRSTPLGNAFSTDPARQAAHARDASVRRAGADAGGLSADVPTVR